MLSQPKGHSAAGRIMSMTNSSDTIGNRTRDLPACSAVPRPTALPQILYYQYINNCPTRCNTKQSMYYSASSLYIFRVSTTPIIRSTQNCNYNLRYWSCFLCSYLPPTWPSLVTLEGGSCTVPEAVVTVLYTYLLTYSMEQSPS